MKKVDYSSTITPADYKCAKCNTAGCKLWREGTSSLPQLLCVDCASKDQKQKIRDVSQGKLVTEQGSKDLIGGYVMAVPHEQAEGYCEYTSIPDAGLNWWQRLPLRRTVDDRTELRPLPTYRYCQFHWDR